jgi:hypothetical protein
MQNRSLCSISGLLLAGAIACVIAYRDIGAYVDENGFLIEPFFLIPMGYLLGFLGLTGLTLWVLGRLLRKPGRRC